MPATEDETGQPGEPAVERLLEALQNEDWNTARLALHPYLHWQLESGVTLRGRKNVLAMLAQTAIPEPPAAAELRDGQIYRWLR